MNDPRPKPPLEQIEISPVATATGARNKVLAAVAGVAAVLVAVWGFGHASPASARAMAGVRAAVGGIDLPEPEPDAPDDTESADDDDEDTADGGAPMETEDDGEPLAELLAEAEVRAKLARASNAPDAGAALRLEAAPAAPRLGSATRMRRIGEQLVAICASGRAADVQPLAQELLLEKPPPWLERRIRAACFGDTSPPPPNEAPEPPPNEAPEP